MKTKTFPRRSVVDDDFETKEGNDKMLRNVIVHINRFLNEYWIREMCISFGIESSSEFDDVFLLLSLARLGHE